MLNGERQSPCASTNLRSTPNIHTPNSFEKTEGTQEAVVQEPEAGELSGVGGQPGLYCEFQASLG